MSSHAHALLTEARLLQRYACGERAPRFALRRYLRLTPPGRKPLPIQTAFLAFGLIVSCLEPLPFLPRSEKAREFERRLFLALLVTEVTPWGARRSETVGARGILWFVLAALATAVLEIVVFLPRIVVHALMWMPVRSSLDE